MPGGVVDDDGRIRKNAPNLVQVGADEKKGNCQPSSLPDPSNPDRMPGQMSNGQYINDLLTPQQNADFARGVLARQNAAMNDARALGASEEMVQKLSTGELVSWMNQVKVDKAANDPGIKADATTTEPNDVTMTPVPSSPAGHSENPICVDEDTVDVRIDTREVNGTIKYETACILFEIFKSDYDKHGKWNMECIDVGGERRKEFTQLDLYVLVEAHAAGFICRVKEDPESTITDTLSISFTPIFLAYVDAWIFKKLPKSTDDDEMVDVGLPPMWFNKEPDVFDICLNQNRDERNLMTILVGEMTQALHNAGVFKDNEDPYDEIEQYVKERMQALYLRGDYAKPSDESDDDEDISRLTAANELFQYFDKTPWLQNDRVFDDQIEQAACDLVLDFINEDNEMFKSFWDEGHQTIEYKTLSQAMETHVKAKVDKRKALLRQTTINILECDSTRIQSSTQAEEYWDRLPKEDKDEFRTESLTLTTKDKIFINKVANEFKKSPPKSPVKDPSIALVTRTANGKRKRTPTDRFKPPDTPSATKSAVPKSPVKPKPLASLSEKIGDIDSDKWNIFYANQDVLCDSIDDEREYLKSQFQITHVSGKQPTGRQIAKLAVGESMKIFPDSQYVKQLTKDGQKEDKSFNLLLAIINNVRRQLEQELVKGKGFKECKQKIHADTVSLEDALKKLKEKKLQEKKLQDEDSSGDSSSESSDADDSALDEDGSEKNACVKVTADDSALDEYGCEKPDDVEKLRSLFDSSDDDSDDEEQAPKKQKVVDYKSFWEQAACMDEVDTNTKNLSDEEKQKVFESMAKTFVAEKFKRATEYEINDKQREYFTKKILDDDMSTLKGRERVLKKLRVYLNK